MFKKYLLKRFDDLYVNKLENQNELNIIYLTLKDKYLSARELEKFDKEYQWGVITLWEEMNLSF